MAIYTPRLIEPGRNAWQEAGDQFRSLGSVLYGMDADRRDREREAEQDRLAQERWQASFDQTQGQIDDARQQRAVEMGLRGVLPQTEVSADAAKGTLQSIGRIASGMPDLNTGGSNPESLIRDARQSVMNPLPGGFVYDPTRDVGRVQALQDERRQTAQRMAEMEREFQMQQDLRNSPYWVPPSAPQFDRVLSDSGEYVYISPTGEVVRSGVSAMLEPSGGGAGAAGGLSGANLTQLFGSVFPDGSFSGDEEQLRTLGAAINSLNAFTGGRPRATFPGSRVDPGDAYRDMRVPATAGPTVAPAPAGGAPPMATADTSRGIASRAAGPPPTVAPSAVSARPRTVLDEAAEHYRWISPDFQVVESAMREDGASDEEVAYMMSKIRGR